VREFSRKINESYVQDFAACSLPQAELSVLKTRSFAACSDIIHELNGSLTFADDMHEIVVAFNQFQQLLAVILERLSLPLSYLYHSKDMGRGSTPRSSVLGEEEEEEEDFPHFDPTIDIVELVNQGTRFTTNDRLYDEWLRAVKFRTAQSLKLNQTHAQQLREVEAGFQAKIHDCEEMIETERATNSTLSDELNTLQEELRQKEREIGHLRAREDDNEFKNACAT
jgi:hypothetical protein